MLLFVSVIMTCEARLMVSASRPAPAHRCSWITKHFPYLHVLPHFTLLLPATSFIFLLLLLSVQVWLWMFSAFVDTLVTIYLEQWQLCHDLLRFIVSNSFFISNLHMIYVSVDMVLIFMSRNFRKDDF